MELLKGVEERGLFSGFCEVDRIICDCGYEDGGFNVYDGEVWTCKKCGRAVKFKWVGMVMEDFE